MLENEFLEPAFKQYTVMRKHILIFAAILVVCLSSNAQVNFSARAFTPSGKQLDDYFSFSLKVECEDTVRYHHWSDTATIAHFENIPIGSRCYFRYNDYFGTKSFDFPIFTINSDIHIDSLVLTPCPKDYGWFWSKAKKDSILHSNAAKWTANIKGYDTLWYDSVSNKYFINKNNPYCLHIARLYYNDWMEPFPSWQTWQHSADSAYKYCLYAYKKYPYLYYPLRQLAHHLGIEFNGKKPKEPNKKTFIPQPTMMEEWWKDTTDNLLYMWKKHADNNSYYKKHCLEKAREKSLCYPVGDNGIVRLIIMNPLGGNSIYRIQNGKLYFKHLRIYKPKLLINDSYELTPMELDSIALLVDAFSRLPRTNDDRGLYVIDGSTYLLEYIIDGKYYYYETSSGAEPKELEDITDAMYNLEKKYYKPSFITRWKEARRKKYL